MILESKSFKEACSKILGAVDKERDTFGLTELVELRKKGDTLYLDVTNKEYYISILFKVDPSTEDYNATVSANLFLKLIPQITTENIELKVENNYLLIKANGDYKIPLVCTDSGEMMELPKINIDNPTTQMSIDCDILKSILNYNCREMLKGSFKGAPTQKLHYIDEQGALTITSGICINNFTLEKPVKILINNKIVKLFKLFEEDQVSFTLGYDPLSEDILQTKVRFETPSVILTAILNCDNTLMKQIPVLKARNKANDILPYKATINKNSLVQSLNRITLFINRSDYNKTTAYFKFQKNSLEITDLDRINSEKISIEGFNGEEYTFLIDLEDLKAVLDTCVDQYITLSFGDGLTILINRLNVINVLPECDIEQ